MLTSAEADARRQAAEAAAATADVKARRKKAEALLQEPAQIDDERLVRSAEIVKGVIASRMRDPSSVAYRNVIATDAGTFFCGEVKGRNGFGGYGEWVPFVAIGHTVYFPDSPIFASTFQSNCVEGWGKQIAPF